MSTDPTRSTGELVDALERHVRVLRDYAHKAFVEGNFDYGGELAGKLRLLVARFRSNRPLLLDLMQQTGINPKLVLDGPPVMREVGEPGPGDEISLERMLELIAVGIRVPSGDYVELTKLNLIRAWAEQTGSAHEDHSMDPALAAVLHAPVLIGGVPGAFAELRTSVDAVLSVADRFIAEYRATSSSQDQDP